MRFIEPLEDISIITLEEAVKMQLIPNSEIAVRVLYSVIKELK